MPKKKRKSTSTSRKRRSGGGIEKQFRPQGKVRLIGQFASWYGVHVAEVEDPDHVATEDIASVLSLLFDLTRDLGFGHTLSAPTAETLAALLDEIEADDETADALDAVTDTLLHYLQFLIETGTWKASDADYDASFAIVEEAAHENPGIMPELIGSLHAVAEIAETEQLAALTALRPIAAVEPLLDWVGRSHVVTGTGALRLGDIEAVSALIGINAAGRRNRKRLGDAALFDPADAETDDQSDAASQVIVGSMWELGPLSAWWQVLLQLNVIETTSTTVRPGRAVARWRSEDPSERYAIRVDFVTQYLSHLLQREATENYMLGPFLVVHLLAQLAAAANPDVVASWGYDAICENVDSTSPLGAVNMHSIPGFGLDAVLDEIQEAGLITPAASADGTMRYAVPEAVRPVVARSLLAIFDEMTVDEAQSNEAPLNEAPPNAHPAGTALQLKISLRDARPPVWRRVLVDAQSTLGNVHWVIQTMFDWDGSHLHRFEQGTGYSRVTFGAFDEFTDDREGVIDEDLAAVGSVLTAPGDKLTYTYDFGDDWRHVIELEKVMAGGTENAPHCVGGRGRAPDEDSGGVWGWGNLVEISADPEHPDWHHALEQLGLAPGETIDPRHFDVAEVNARLASAERMAGLGPFHERMQ